MGALPTLDEFKVAESSVPEATFRNLTSLEWLLHHAVVVTTGE